MGIENVEALTGNEETAETTEKPARPTDQEIKDRQQDELAAAREEHNRRTGGGQYAKKPE